MTSRLQVIQGDITQLSVDAIVNAANASLMGGGGVDGAIHRAAGPALLDACKLIRQQQGECQTGHCGYHACWQAFGKRRLFTQWGPSGEAANTRKLSYSKRHYRNCLLLAEANHFRSIAFPAISTGVYGYPRAQAAEVAVRTVSDFITRYALPEQVLLCLL
ncbi:O-acetyl-ADP-ribose deacetylase [Salmonella enterica subsp. enterica]|uniref:O-acetyl-ADP-ribose deacetylase n=1 Tax=Salmonella enterica I TaxID=59201 RepID=A0A3S4JG85_SALET|nr:O-acetyl-ADP-ribose deacetylase [Salmonella enterica subsp. enterica]